MPKLTKRIVDATQASNGQAFVWDAELRGFALRVTRSGAKAFVLQYRTSTGRSRRMTIGRYGPLTVDAAREKALRLLAAIADGEDPVERKAEARKALTVADLARLYLTEGPTEKPNKKASSWQTDRSNIERHLVPLLGKRLANTLTSSDIAKFQADVAAGMTAKDEKTGPRGRAIVKGGRGTAARSLAVLSAVLEHFQPPPNRLGLCDCAEACESAVLNGMEDAHGPVLRSGSAGSRDRRRALRHAGAPGGSPLRDRHHDRNHMGETRSGEWRARTAPPGPAAALEA